MEPQGSDALMPGLVGAGGWVCSLPFQVRVLCGSSQGRQRVCRYQPKHTAILLWTKQVLGRKRRNLEAFLEETAAELDCGSCLETVCGAGRGIRKAKARDGR